MRKKIRMPKKVHNQKKITKSEIRLVLIVVFVAVVLFMGCVELLTNTATTQSPPFQNTYPTAVVTITPITTPSVTETITPGVTPSNTVTIAAPYPTETTDTSGCPPGEYRVSGYYRKSGTYVNSYCRHYPNEG